MTEIQIANINGMIDIIEIIHNESEDTVWLTNCMTMVEGIIIKITEKGGKDLLVKRFPEYNSF